MTRAKKRRLRYRADPEFRERILASNRKSRERDGNPNRERLNALAAEICRLRGVVDRAQKFLEAKDRQLISLVEERERLKRNPQKMFA